ncbi:MAG: CAP domain-containing protein [Nitrospirota bacterium]|nr:CAP domain-containing protein [Nitrospirota bacterium]MDH5769510.1 CAP domain-containing protein [Nitrospirota bacterium]
MDKNLAESGDFKKQRIEKRVVELINEMRTKGSICGEKNYKPANPVAWNDKLGKASLHHSLDMARNGFLGHKGYDGSSTKERLSRIGYKWITFGENVAEGYRTTEELVKGWIESTSHCKVIMNPDFKEAGAAYAKSSGKFYWTLILASPER